MQRFLLFAALCCLVVVAFGSPEECKWSYGEYSWDLSEYADPEEDYSRDSDTDRLVMNICGVSKSCPAPETEMLGVRGNASVCQINVADGAFISVPGFWSEPQWGLIDAENVTKGIRYTLLGDECYTKPGEQRTVEVNFICSAYDDHKFVWTEPSDCIFVIDFETPKACVGAPPPLPVEDDCTFETGGQKWNFSSLKTVSEYQVAKEGADVFVAICGEAPSCTNPVAAGCSIEQETTVQTSFATWDTGLTADWQPIDATDLSLGVQYTLANGPTCSEEGTTTTFTVKFKCNKETPGTYTFDEVAVCQYVFEIETELACLPDPPLPACEYVVSDKTYDLSALNLIDDEYMIKTVDEDIYMMNVCGAAPTCAQIGGGSGASACYARPGHDEPRLIYALSFFDREPEPIVEMIDPGKPNAGVKLTYKNGEPCHGPEETEGQNITTIVNFRCHSDTPETFKVVQRPLCTFTIDFPTDKACVDGDIPPKQDPCKIKLFTGQEYDLTELRHPYGYTQNTDDHIYYMNICAAADQCKNPDGLPALACSHTKEDVYEGALAFFGDGSASYKWDLIDFEKPEAGIKVDFTNGYLPPQCNQTATTINFNCDWTTPGTFEVTEIQECWFVLDFKTHLTCGGDPPAPADPCTFNEYDLSKLPRDVDYYGTDGTYDYAVNVCAPADDCKNIPWLEIGQRPTMCQFTQADEYVLYTGLHGGGSQSADYIWGYNDEADHTAGVFIKQENSGDWCTNAAGSAVHPTSMIKIYCAPATPTTLQVVRGDCTYTVDFPTPEACPKVDPSSSTGPGPEPEPSSSGPEPEPSSSGPEPEPSSSGPEPEPESSTGPEPHPEPSSTGPGPQPDSSTGSEKDRKDSNAIGTREAVFISLAAIFGVAVAVLTFLLCRRARRSMPLLEDPYMIDQEQGHAGGNVPFHSLN